MRCHTPHKVACVETYVFHDALGVGPEVVVPTVIVLLVGRRLGQVVLRQLLAQVVQQQTRVLELVLEAIVVHVNLTCC